MALVKEMEMEKEMGMKKVKAARVVDQHSRQDAGHTFHVHAPVRGWIHSCCCRHDHQHCHQMDAVHRVWFDCDDGGSVGRVRTKGTRT